MQTFHHEMLRFMAGLRDLHSLLLYGREIMSWNALRPAANILQAPNVHGSYACVPEPQAILTLQRH